MCRYAFSDCRYRGTSSEENLFGELSGFFRGKRLLVVLHLLAEVLELALLFLS